MWRDDNDKIMDILDNVESADIAHFPVICPICGEKEAHLYFHKYEKEDNKGGMWAWCSACQHSAHTMYRIPKWWENLNIIKFEELTSFPDFLESNKGEIDRWLNRFLINRRVN